MARQPIKVLDKTAPVGAQGTGGPYPIDDALGAGATRGLIAAKVTGGTATLRLEGRVDPTAPFVQMAPDTVTGAGGIMATIDPLPLEIRVSWILNTGTRIEVWVLA